MHSIDKGANVALRHRLRKEPEGVLRNFQVLIVDPLLRAFPLEHGNVSENNTDDLINVFHSLFRQVDTDLKAGPIRTRTPLAAPEAVCPVLLLQVGDDATSRLVTN